MSSTPQQSYNAMSNSLFSFFQLLSFFPFFAVSHCCLPVVAGNTFNEQYWNLVNSVSMAAKLGNICFQSNLCFREAKVFLTPDKNIFCFRAAKFVSATYFPRATKLGNISLRSNVSPTMFPSLARPLRCQN